MANVMSLKQFSNKVKRNGFDLSFKNAFTAKAGELLPIMVKEVIPGDKFNIKGQAFTRTQPLNSAAFVRMREYFDFYFVPYRLLWNRSSQFFTNLPDFHHAVNIMQQGDSFEQHPYFSRNEVVEYIQKFTSSQAGTANNYLGFNRGKCTLKLMEYLGYGDMSKETTDDVVLNPFPLLAYQKIYQDFYRFDQWEQAAAYRYNLDYITTTNQLGIGLSSIISRAPMVDYNMFDLNYSNWAKDYFMGLLPTPQYGTESFAPIMETVHQTMMQYPTLMDSSNTVEYDSTGKPVSGKYTGSLSGDAQLNVQGTLSAPSTGNVLLGSGTTVASALYTHAFGNMFSQSGSLSVLALRKSEALQKWKEIAGSGRYDYKTQMEKHFNVSPSEAMSDHCRYLGGWTSNLDVNEVTNTNLATEGDEAKMFGKGIFSSVGGADFESKEHGILMCIYHNQPLLDYNTDGIRKLNLKSNFTDYAIPEFDSVGMQEVNSLELSLSALSGEGDVINNVLLGYAPRYVDYKTAFDETHGAFNDSLQYWVAPITDDYFRDVFYQDDKMTYVFFKVSPSLLDSIFAVNVDSTVNTDQFLVNSFFDVKVVRNLDYNGLPY